jgi:hypothetical protein
VSAKFILEVFAQEMNQYHIADKFMQSRVRPTGSPDLICPIDKSGNLENWPKFSVSDSEELKQEVCQPSQFPTHVYSAFCQWLLRVRANLRSVSNATFHLPTGPPWPPLLLMSSRLRKPAREHIIATIATTTTEWFFTEEFQVLQALFSSGVTLKELRSIGIIAATLTDIDPPPRAFKRTLPSMVQWFRVSWSSIGPILPFIQLRDANEVPIDGRREVLERGLKAI